MGFKTIGWQDIVLNVPDEWELVFATKTPKKKGKEITGYFGFRTTEKKILEFRWVEVEQGKIPDLTVVIEDYFKTLVKTQKKIKKRTENEIKIATHKGKTLYWATEDMKLHGYIVAWNCDVLKRLVIMQSQFSSDDAKKNKADIMQVLETANCHPIDYESRWIAPNLTVMTPRAMTLIKQAFLVGLSFFQLRYKALDIYCYRMGLANQKITTIDELPVWFVNYYPKMLPGIPSGFKPKESEFTRMTIGKTKGNLWHYNNKKQKRNLPLGSKSELQGYFWQNKEKNDIYCILFKFKRQTATDKSITQIIENIMKLAITNN